MRRAPAGFVTALDDDCTHAGRLPDGGSYAVNNLYNVTPTGFTTAARNSITLA